MMLDVSTRLCVIVGGGEVAARKAKGLVDAGATRVRVIAPELKATFPADVEIVVSRFDVRHLDGAGLVFASTDDESVNDAVVKVARANNILVNRADQDDESTSDFLTPAKLTKGDVTICLTAISPALAVYIRGEIEKAWNPGWSAMAAAMNELRPVLIKSNIPIATRRKIFRELASADAIDLLTTRGFDALRDWICQRYPEVSHA